MGDDIIGSDSDFRDNFLRGAARAFFVTAYADYVEEGYSTDNELDEDERLARTALPKPGGGEDRMDYAPPTPPAAYALAGELWALLAAANRKTGGIYGLVQMACKADGLTDEQAESFDVEDFGHYIAMQAMGHGVSWFDDHKKFPLVVPRIECSQCSFSDAAYKAEGN